MATQAMNFRMDEADIREMKVLASVFHITVTDIVRQAVREYIDKARQDPLYRLTANVEDADPKEATEILDGLNRLTEDDLSIVTSEHMKL